MKYLVGIILLFVAFQFLPMFMTSIHDTVTSEASTSVAVATGVGVTTGTVTLSNGLYNGDIVNVVSISSSNATAGDVPVAVSYASATDILTVGGLGASATRTLTVAYDWESTSQYTGFGDILMLAPIIVVLMLIGSLFWKKVKTN